MPITFSCPQCGKQTNVADQYAGQTGPCQACGATITIPYPNKPAYAPPPTKSGGSSGAGIGVMIGVGVLLGVFLCGGVGLALLLPAVQAAREAARRMSCRNNLKQVAIALHNYHDTYKTFPPSVINDKDGKPMHSWRTMILPFIEQQPLYDRYDSHVPWDSPQNQGVVNVPIPVYQCPSDATAGTGPYTNYMYVVGPGGAFDGQKKLSLAQIRDGSSNTILLVEIPGGNKRWAEPGDITVDELMNILDGRTNHPGGIQVAMADGSVLFLDQQVDRENLRRMLNPDDGMAVEMPLRN